MKKVKDIMAKEVIGILPDILVKDAAKFLFEKEISGLPVIDKEGHLLGMFTEKDLVKNALPSYVKKVGSFVYGDAHSTIKKISNLVGMKVKDIMRKEVVTIDEDAPLVEAARLMFTERARRIPVIKNGKVIGIIARCDVIKELVKDAGVI